MENVEKERHQVKGRYFYNLLCSCSQLSKHKHAYDGTLKRINTIESGLKMISQVHGLTKKRKNLIPLLPDFSESPFTSHSI